MKKITFFLSIFTLMAVSCVTDNEQHGESVASKFTLEPGDVFAWCIVPFDSVRRSPEARIDMLKSLGINAYAYDWRAEHLPEMTHELTLAEEKGIHIQGVWMWIDANQDSPGKLSEGNEQVLKSVQEAGLNTQIWAGFNYNYFENLGDEEAIQRGKEMISYLDERAKMIGCKIALYNHGDWFGEPANQVKIIQTMPGRDIGIIYSFHHGHHQIDRFGEVVSVMLPYLWGVNLNGMKKEGPQILPLGTGDQEAGMVSTLVDAGYKGPFGVLGHVMEDDVQHVLEQNLAGLSKLTK
ncbi:MAG: AP endonuclease [Bacteroidia bacterium]